MHDMQITDVISHQLVVNVDEPFTSSRGWYYKTKGALVVEIRTEMAASPAGAIATEPQRIRFNKSWILT